MTYLSKCTYLNKVIIEKSRGEGWSKTQLKMFLSLIVLNFLRKKNMEIWKNRPQKLPNRPKSSPNLNSCSIKISHRATLQHKDTFVTMAKKIGIDTGVDFSRLVGCVKDKLKTRPASFSEKWLL